VVIGAWRPPQDHPHVIWLPCEDVLISMEVVNELAFLFIR
jgi:hypothetical protein